MATPRLFSAATVLCLLSVYGCGPSERLDSKLDRMRAEVDQRFEEEITRKREIVSEEARALLPATSAERLVEAYNLAYAAGDITTIAQMTHFEEGDFADENLRESLLVLGLGTGTSGKSTVTKHQLIELTEAEKSRFAKRIPTAKFEFTTRYNDDSGGSSRSAWVADVDGHSVFYFAKPKEEPEEQ
jgi:hypothetical protein